MRIDVAIIAQGKRIAAAIATKDAWLQPALESLISADSWPMGNRFINNLKSYRGCTSQRDVAELRDMLSTPKAIDALANNAFSKNQEKAAVMISTAMDAIPADDARVADLTSLQDVKMLVTLITGDTQDLAIRMTLGENMDRKFITDKVAEAARRGRAADRLITKSVA